MISLFVYCICTAVGRRACADACIIASHLESGRNLSCIVGSSLSYILGNLWGIFKLSKSGEAAAAGTRTEPRPLERGKDQ